MTLTETPLCEFGKNATDFSLKATDGSTWDLAKAKDDNGLLVMFICNHCPYVKAIIDRLVIDCKELQINGIGCIAIMPNDTKSYPSDSFENMMQFAEQHRFSFPYVIDETQEIAKAYHAVCTPDFFGFNKNLELQYRGRFDTAGVNAPDESTEKELRPAMLQVAKTGVGPKQQNASMGCSIKWCV